MSRAGFVLAGGLSSRMGCDKALLTTHGVTLLERAAGQVRIAAGNVTVIAPPDRYAGLLLEVIGDLQPGQGPLGGILTALSCSQADWNLIVAVDMPRIDAPFLASLFEQAEATDADLLLPLNSEGRPEPLCGVYNRRCRGAIERAMAAGIRKVTGAFGELRTADARPQTDDLFTNLNTPQEWSAHNA